MTLKICLAGILALTASTFAAETPDEEALKNIIRAETECYYKADADGWEATWKHDAEVTRTFVDPSRCDRTVGWSGFGPETATYLKLGKPIPMELKQDHFIIRTGGNLAWVEYRQFLHSPGADPKDRRLSHEYRVLAKENGEWKIVSAITTDPEGFNPGPRSRETALNTVGYQLLGEKETKEAVEVLKLNASLNPTSSNAYDSLGEAYAADGDKALAIANYEKALALDPKSESSKAALAKLKQ